MSLPNIYRILGNTDISTWRGFDSVALALSSKVQNPALGGRVYFQLRDCIGHLVLKGKHQPNLESYIQQVAEIAYRYSFKTIKGRWLPGEKVIAKDREYAYAYADEIVHGKWEIGEPAISKSVWESFSYAMHVAKEKFPAGEKTILESLEGEDGYGQFSGVELKDFNTDLRSYIAQFGYWKELEDTWERMGKKWGLTSELGNIIFYVNTVHKPMIWFEKYMERTISGEFDSGEMHKHYLNVYGNYLEAVYTPEEAKSKKEKV